jgi:GntR family transcriptional regulator
LCDSHLTPGTLPYYCTSTVILRIHSASGIPIYLQIETQIKQAVAAGAISQEEALPSVRKLAAELRVNPNTVARAYSNLERDGLIRTVPGGGTYISASSSGLLKTEKLRRVRPLAMQLAVEGKQVELTRQDLQKLLDQACNELESNG